MFSIETDRAPHVILLIYVYRVLIIFIMIQNVVDITFGTKFKLRNLWAANMV